MKGIHGIVPPSMPRYPIESVKGYDFQPEKAKQLLADAGYPNGQGFPPVTLQYNEGGGRNSSVAERIQQELKGNLGVNIELQMLQWPQHTDKVEQGEADFYRLGWIADYPDPENFLNLLYGANAMPIGETSYLNSTRYSNPEFDALFEQALRTPDDAERYKLYAQAEQIAVDDAPMMWIFYDLDFRLVQPWIENYHSNAMDRRDYTEVWYNPAKLGASREAS
jgi:peptide/nickel transport system substrate-binding protein